MTISKAHFTNFAYILLLSSMMVIKFSMNLKLYENDYKWGIVFEISSFSSKMLTYLPRNKKKQETKPAVDLEKKLAMYCCKQRRITTIRHRKWGKNEQARKKSIRKKGSSTFALNHFVIFIASDIRAMKHFFTLSSGSLISSFLLMV